MVNRSRDQSTPSPSRRIWPRILPPDSAFHSQTRLTNASRPRSWRLCPAVGELALDDVLGGDAGVVHARQPEHLVALHPPPPGERVHQGVLERVPDVQRAGDVGRGQDDRVRRLVAARVGREYPRGHPALVERTLYLGRRVLRREVLGGGLGSRLGHVPSLEIRRACSLRPSSAPRR